jgi:DNA-binding transcriptional LysR family regulator
MDALEPSWELYRSFLAVLGEGSLSAAGRRLGLSQPTVGRHVQALETALGLVLFVRSQDGLSPTDAALAMEAHVRDMAMASAAIVRTASGESGDARGVVRVTASEVVGAEVLPPLLTAFRERHPGVAVELVLSNRNEDLLRREADIAVRMSAPTQNAIRTRKLGVVRLGLYAHKTYVARHGLPLDPEDLASRSIIGFDRRPSLPPERISSATPITRDLFALRTDNDLAGLAALRAGFGLGFCQAPLAARDPNLVPLDPSFASTVLEVWLAMHEDLRAVRRMRLMFDHLADGLSAYLSG